MKRPAYAAVVLTLTTFGAGLALAQSAPSVPATGTSNYGYTPPAGTPVTPHNQGGQGAIPPVGQQIPAAQSVQKNDPNRQPASLLHQADQALTQRKVAVANELLERSQTAVMNANQLDSDTSTKVKSGIESARQAVIAGNMPEAHRQIKDVIGMLPAESGQAPSAGANRPRR